MTDDLRAFSNELFATAPPPARLTLTDTADPDTTVQDFTRTLFANNEETS